MVISDAWRQRFGGTARLYGEKALQLFADAHICVVGIGGVGSWAAEALARTGIGAITLIDMDDVCVTNTNRQIHALRDNVGLAKAEENRSEQTVYAVRYRIFNKILNYSPELLAENLNLVEIGKAVCMKPVHML